MTTREVAALQGELKVSAERQSVLEVEGEERVRLLREELSRHEEELARLSREREGLSAEERREREVLAQTVADLEAHREQLNFKITNYEKTILSLKSQVCSVCASPVCLSVYVCLCVSVSLYVFVSVYVSVCLSVCVVCECLCVWCVHVFLSISMLCVSMYLCVCVCVCEV